MKKSNPKKENHLFKRIKPGEIIDRKDAVTILLNLKTNIKIVTLLLITSILEIALWIEFKNSSPIVYLGFLVVPIMIYIFLIAHTVYLYYLWQDKYSKMKKYSWFVYIMTFNILHIFLISWILIIIEKKWIENEYLLVRIDMIQKEEQQYNK